MFLLRRPSDESINATINAQRAANLTYGFVGWTECSMAPPGFSVNHWTSVIGKGGRAFARAKDAMHQYRMLTVGWLQRIGPVEPIVRNSIVCTLARQMGMYSLNVGRIIYVDDQTSERFGFGYGTLPEHALVGEERFMVMLDTTSENVRFEIFSFSRPQSMLMRAIRPLLWRAQRRFCVDATAAMRDSCQS